MEVLHDNPAGQDRSRRKHDRDAPPDRWLDWSNCDNDILLQPMSAAAIGDVLSTPSLHIDLLPENPSAAAPEPAANTTHVPRLQLATRHDQAALQALCKRVLVDNALIKQRGQRQLFLTAGFLELEMPAAEPDAVAVRWRAPLLLYPVILARRVELPGIDLHEVDIDVGPMPDDAVAQRGVGDAGTRSRPLAYELRLDGTRPQCNPALLRQCRDVFDVQLPEPEESASLSRYFAQIADVLAGTPAVSMSLEMALGTLPIGQETALITDGLPALPAHFDPTLALVLANTQTLDSLDTVLEQLAELHMGTLPERLLPASNDSPGQVHGQLHDYCSALIDQALGHVDFARLGSLPGDLERWSGCVRDALQLPLITDVLAMPEITALQLMRLAGVIELIDKAPGTLPEFAHADLCFESTSALLRRARHQARLIDEEVKANQAWFDLTKLPQTHRLLQMMDELERAAGRDPDLVGASHFHARRQFMEFCLDKPTQVTAVHLQRLQQLAKLLRFRELFVNNAEYRLAFGPGYRGLRTDWATLETAVDYARELADALGSDALASRALQQWGQFKDCFVTGLATVQRATEQLRKVLWVIGADHQNQVAAQVLVRASEIARSLSELQACHHRVCTDLSAQLQSDPAQTPAAVLARHGDQSERSLEQCLLVEKGHRHIRQRRELGTLSDAGVSDTLDWLREVSRTLGEQPDDEGQVGLGRLVERLTRLSSAS